jgi:hypothetical protein
MSHEDDVRTMVHREFRRRGFRRFFVRVGLVMGLILGGLVGVAVPTQSTYTDALHRQAQVEQYAADAILDKYTSLLSYLEGGKDAAFLRNEKIDARVKELYREHRRQATGLDAEAKAVTEGVRDLPVSVVTHPMLAMRAGIEGLGKPDLLHTQVYKQAGAGALVGCLVGLGLAALVTHRRREKSSARSSQ